MGEWVRWRGGEGRGRVVGAVSSRMTWQGYKLDECHRGPVPHYKMKVISSSVTR